MGKFGIKNALLGYFWTRIFKKLSSYLKLATSNLLISKISQEKQKELNLGPKMLYFVFGYVWARILKKLL